MKNENQIVKSDELNVQKGEKLSFANLVSIIEQTHSHFQQQAVKAVNVSLTIRNYLIGFYLVEFEQNGEDRAAYGSKLLDSVAAKLRIKGLVSAELSRCRQFYFCYPQILGALTQEFKNLVPQHILGALSQESNRGVEPSIMGSSTPQATKPNLYVPAEKLLGKLSFSHLVELIKIQDHLKRTFYEIECIKGTWSVRELKRQINTLAYERIGLSANLELADVQLMNKITPELPEHAIKNIYTFDFLGLRSDGLIEEKDLETAILNHLQDFIQELGLGFCFEYRQKRILIDDEYFFIDLVFYHRILKCHVVVELKVDAFKHEYLSQLNTYVAYFNAEVKRSDDNPAIGILLCTEKGNKLVEYATAGMDNQLFVSKYLLELPKKEQLEAFILKELEAWK
jgi:predicted nuclease of restriction endonuclease-like (RecB) superfamily